MVMVIYSSHHWSWISNKLHQMMTKYLSCKWLLILTQFFQIFWRTRPKYGEGLNTWLSIVVHWFYVKMLEPDKLRQNIMWLWFVVPSCYATAFPVGLLNKSCATNFCFELYVWRICENVVWSNAWNIVLEEV